MKNKKNWSIIIASFLLLIGLVIIYWSPKETKPAELIKVPLTEEKLWISY
jgi:hypothetical protein